MTNSGSSEARDRDTAGRARNARPRDGLGRPLPYGAEGVPRQPEGVLRAPQETVGEAQALLAAGRPFHAHEVFEDAWKSGPREERPLWRGLAQLAVGLTHAARGNAVGGSRLLRRGAGAVEEWAAGQGEDRPYGLDLPGLTRWARELAGRVERDSAPVDPRAEAPWLGPAEAPRPGPAEAPRPGPAKAPRSGS
ncbi:MULTISPECIES: DUF309 domain-containing protein [Streptomyces]|uniref:DUF309 domain-containing protein n=1 Tax=Streptomyces eurythermus TaxID=42237 RepID=A0ABW6ZBD2_9ACTN|nr:MULTISPECIES: DUF309 domain-containing protein [Streptomyces]QIS74348.1 DUF309 domain-containing protein [Streptomyces sp. DSM 40868]WDM16982.1 DUF309 domain-containing protein [Streptomyces lavenduligriseus]